MRCVLFCLALASVSSQAAEPLWPGVDYDPSVPTFEQVLGYAPGERISSHAAVIKYFDALKAAIPDQVTITPYAESWQGRSLIYVSLVGVGQTDRLQQLQQGMQQLANPANLSSAEADRLIDALPASAWLAYAVHGNEISSTDAAMMTAYHLLAARNDAVVEQILANTVVFIDPLQNPDGRDRFVHNYYNTLGSQPDADPYAAEHDEPWPSGRVNHYLFDMNRDWIALTQPETRGRIAALLKWQPLVFVDVHEMGSNSTYYFAPEAVPYNPHLASGQRASLQLFGKNNAHWFDQFGIDYFTREVFDAFYPGYGASWPSYFGSVAMTYEQASTGGHVIRRRNGTDLSYRTAVRNHFVSSISTVQATAVNRERLLADFHAYKQSAIDEGRNGDIRNYLINIANNRAGANKLAGLLVEQGVRVERAESTFKACGVDYAAGSYKIDLAQPAKRLIRTLLDSNVPMPEDFVTEQERRRQKDLPHDIYDVTAWSLPLMFNVEVNACDRTGNASFDQAGSDWVRPGAPPQNRASVAYLVPWGDLSAVKLLTEAFTQGLKVKSSNKPFTQSGRKFPAGTLIFKVDDNAENLHQTLTDLSNTTGADVIAISDSWVEDGPNYGSQNVVDLFAPRIAMAWDSPTSVYGAGNTRYVIEQQLGYPVSVIRTAQLARMDLRRYDVVILPEQGFRGSYQRTLGAAGAANLAQWVESGGTLIGLGSALRYLTDPDNDLMALRREKAFTDKDESKASDEATVAGTLIESEQELLAQIEPESQGPDTVPGVLVRAKTDSDHWLTAGIAETLNVLVRGPDVYAPLPLDEGSNVVRFAAADELVASGHLWEENRKQLAFKPFVAVQASGRGHYIGFTHDPNYRAYLDGLNVIFAAALFRAPAHATVLR